MSDRDAITVNRLPGSHNGVVAYNWRTGKISVADGPYDHQNVSRAINGLHPTPTRSYRRHRE